MHQAPRILSAAVLTFATSCAIPDGPPIHKLAQEVNATLQSTKTILGPGDVLDVSFDLRPDWSHEAVITPDGFATFKIIDQVQVAGMSLAQIDEILTEAYDGQVEDIEVTVSVRSFAGRFVSVIGEVKTSGAIGVEGDERLTIPEAITRAGGFSTRTSDLTKLMLVRWDLDQQRQISWVMDARPRYWGKADTIYLQPYDLIFVPNLRVDNIAIWVENYIIRMLPFPRFIIPGA